MGTVESLALFLPEIALSVTVLALIFFDLLAVARTDKANATGFVALGGVIIALGASLAQWGHEPTMLFGRMVVFDAFAVFFKVLLGLSLVAAILMSMTSREIAGAERGRVLRCSCRAASAC
jgi:NADH:ubiquinone oxidoreductase subunit 2 (subunit N)